MRGMILAAGRGGRMGELTERTPKPLLRVKGQYLIEYAIHSMRQAGISDIIINVSYQAEAIRSVLQDGKPYDVNIIYSYEEERLETGGGIFQALPLLGKKPFVVMSSDIITDYPIKNLSLHPNRLAHLLLVQNPAFHPEGDFGLDDNVVSLTAKPTYTYANIGVYHPDLFKTSTHGHFKLRTVLLPAIQASHVTGEYYQGKWYNIGTPQDLLQPELNSLT